MPDEDHKQRIDRELNELLQELRVALPGVQVLLAFLFTVPFSQRFPTVGETTKTVYFVSVAAAALATVLFIAPTAHHRVNFRGGNKEQVLLLGNQLARAGLFCLAAAIGAAMYVVVDVVYDSTSANVAAALTTVGALLVWFVLPLLISGTEGDDRDDGDGDGDGDATATTTMRELVSTPAGR